MGELVEADGDSDESRRMQEEASCSCTLNAVLYR